MNKIELRAVDLSNLFSDPGGDTSVRHFLFFAAVIFCLGTSILSIYLNFRPGLANGSGNASYQMDVVFEDRRDTRSFVERFSSERETAWCLHGRVEEGRYVVSRVEWIGFYGAESSIRYSTLGDCELRPLQDRVLGTVHSHPSVEVAGLSRQDAYSFAGRSFDLFMGVAVDKPESNVTQVRFFDQDSLVNGFDTVTVPSE